MSKTKMCPECAADIPYAATSCACGWEGGKRHTEAPKSRDCSAYGCPLPGSASGSTKGDGTFYCTQHYGQKTEDFDSITIRIRERAWLVRLIGRLQAIDCRDWLTARDQAASYCVSKGRADLSPLPGEYHDAYEHRLRKALSSECAPPRNKAPKSLFDESAPAPGALADFLPEAA